MEFKPRNLRALAEMVIGNAVYFPYRSSSYITEFFSECDLDFQHDGSTRWAWTFDRLAELLNQPQPAANMLPSSFVKVFRVLLDKTDAQEDDADRSKALAALNIPLNREGYEAYYDENSILYIRHIGTKVISEYVSPHRPLTPAEEKRLEQLSLYLEKCSEDELIENMLMPMFRQLGFHKITVSGHKDKALEYGKDIWMRYVIPTQHVLYFGVQVKKGKLDYSGLSRKDSNNIAEIHNQALMMLGHEIFDPETSKKVLVDHAFIVPGGEITKAAKNWLGGKLDSTKRSQIMFMDKDEIINLFTVNNIPLPVGALSIASRDLMAEIPF